MKPSKPLRLLALLGAFTLCAHAQTGVISVNFGGNAENARPAPEDVAGAVPAANWNNPFGTPDFQGSPLFFSDGTPSDATISAQGGKGNRTTRVTVDVADANTKLFNRGWGLNNAADSVLKVGGVPLSGVWAEGYDVYVYFAPDAAVASREPQEFSLASGDVILRGLLDPGVSNYVGEFVQLMSAEREAPGGGNYVVFSGLRYSEFTLTGKTEGFPNAVAITGLQIVARGVKKAGTAKQ